MVMNSLPSYNPLKFGCSSHHPFLQNTSLFPTDEGNCMAPAAVCLPLPGGCAPAADHHHHLRRLTLKPHAISPFKHGFHDKNQLCSSNRIENLERVKVMLSSQSKHKSKALFMVDTLKKLSIDHYFKEEIAVISDISYIDMHKFCEGGEGNLTDIAQQFKLLREAGHDVSSDVFQRFMDEKGEFMPSLCNNLNGLMSLHEASFLNMGEEILYKANEFSTIHLKSCSKDLEPDAGALLRHTLEQPYHLSLKQYKAKNYLKLPLLLRNNVFTSMKELVQIELQTNQQLYQDEFKNITRWWKDLGLANELTFARDQILKWYLWPMTVLPGPQFSKHRLEITKAISLVYLMDDIFDIMGTAEELAQFTKAINRWEDSSALPGYMRVCFNALKEVTSGIVRFVEQEYGWNPTCFIRRSWAKLCKAFLVESKWLANNQVPNAEYYLRNAIISSGVLAMMEIAFYLLGHRATSNTVHIVEGESPLVSCPAKILRLWDDLGSAKDENQEGYDGSYVKCYMKDNPHCSIDAAREHTKNLISKSWEELNREYFFNTSFSPYFTEASLNCARMVRVMYDYDEERKLPMMNDYIQNLLSGK